MKLIEFEDYLNLKICAKELNYFYKKILKQLIIIK